MSDCCKIPSSSCDITEQDYVDSFEDSLPRGILWCFDNERTYPKFWRAIASQFYKLNLYICQVIDELNPCTTVSLLNRHADLWGYPVQCLGYPTDSEQLCEWLNLVNGECGGTSVQFYKDLVDFAGLTGVSYEEINHDGAQAGCAQAGCSQATSDGCGCGLLINVPTALFEESHLATGECCGQAGKPICNSRVPLLECLLSGFLPAHLEIIYNPI